jgi:hypothetical protein
MNIEQIFFDVIKTQTKALFQPVRGDQLKIRIGHRLI